MMKDQDVTKTKVKTKAKGGRGYLERCGEEKGCVLCGEGEEAEDDERSRCDQDQGQDKGQGRKGVPGEMWRGERVCVVWGRGRGRRTDLLSPNTQEGRSPS
eukprot:TRINITY_DN7113_c0_g1_i1.p1 TRINITY_DN7113_c0_g1~~TRINITY_DN7113_c0_g1_i1.p1  ORF type:complete len:108 (+),score=10.16 TRINITY_DN7113_c0_g1_i1:24-326(+)